MPSFFNQYIGFETWYRISESISAVGLVICIFLLLSWAFLPVEKTRRHYLSICLVIGIVLEAVGFGTPFFGKICANCSQLAFVVPLGVKPNQCFDEITPNNMHTSITCAFSGAFIVGGALVVTVWSRHLSPSLVSRSLLIPKSFRPSTLHAFADMLGHRSRPNLLLRLTSCRLGRGCGSLCCHHDDNRSVFSLWRCLSCQCPPIDG